MLLSVILAVMLYAPGQVVPDKEVESKGVDEFFMVSDIPDEIFSVMEGRSFKKDCTVPRDSLKYILCLHRDAEGNAIVGEMVVAGKVADRVLNILKKLFAASYPIERMRLIDYWDADDGKSMLANNSSAFNFRLIARSTKMSKHALGIAIDINPLHNPFYLVKEDGTEIISPLEGKKYLDRTLDDPYMIKDGDLCCRLFKENGFEWGGDWKSRKDYQHFELR